MNDIQPRTTTSPGSSPVPATRAQLDLVAKFTNRLEDDPDNFRRKLLSAKLAPCGAERAALVDRREHLLDALTPSPETLRPVVIALLSGFPTYGADREAAGAVVSLVCRALNDVPTWAVQEAAGRFIKGNARIPWNPAQAPTAPQIRAEALQAMLPVETELHRLNSVLDATLVDTDTTDDERAAALAHWATLRAGIAKSNVLSERTDDEVARERAEFARVNSRFEGKREGSFSVATEDMRRTLASLRRGETTNEAAA